MKQKFMNLENKKSENKEKKQIKEDELLIRYGEFGGRYLPPEFEEVFNILTQEFEKVKNDSEFLEELRVLFNDYVGRPSPLYFAKNLSKKCGNRIYFKREDLNHTGAHKINNTLGQVLLAKRMGKKKVIAETGAGQHGVATATAATLLGLECEIFMGKIDAEKQSNNVYRMKLLGSKVNVIEQGTKSLKDAVDAALEHFAKNPETFYVLGSVVGPQPYPEMVRFFQSVIGQEAKEQILKKENKMPDYCIACIGGGSNAIGLFSGFLDSPNTKLIGVEPAGKGLKTTMHAATLTLGSPGIIHGFKTYLLQDKNGDPLPVYSIASGLDYPGVGPEFAQLKKTNKSEFVTVDDKEALNAFKKISLIEGIIPALETSHALAHVMKMPAKDKVIIVNFSGRGDKDVEFVSKLAD